MMKWLFVSISMCMCLYSASAESLLLPLNSQGYGTLKARVQSLTMYRDYEDHSPGHAYSTTMGLRLGYTSPHLAGLRLGLVWDYAEPLGASDGSDNGKILLGNGRINVLTEMWLQYQFGRMGLTNTFIRAGRQVVNSEVFRADEFRQKPRSLEAVTLTAGDIKNTIVTAGHAWKLSNWIDNEDAWTFKDIEEVLGSTNDTRGVTWIEAVYTGLYHLELALYDAWAHDIANIAGGRLTYAFSDTIALIGYYRHEHDIGKGPALSTDLIGMALRQKLGGIILEPGYFSVRGDHLLFQETTTGIHHPLGASMLIYTKHFQGGSDTAYLKATTRIGDTVLYALYNYTAQDIDSSDRQEINTVVKQICSDNLSVALKMGVGYSDSKSAGHTVATDSRLFVTYHF